MKKHLIIYSFAGILLASMFFCIVSSASAQVSVSTIQGAIKAAGANWVAAENHITKLSPDEQKRLLGVKNAPKTNTHPPTKVTAAYGLPASLDWRNNGGNYVTAVRDQSACGSCWAHSGIAALESATLINNRTPNTELNLSEQVLISCCSSICSPQGDCGGGYPEKAADFLRDQGAPAESCYPYVMNGTCPNACPNWQASAYKIKSWEWVVDYNKSEGPTVDAIKAGLQYGPLAITYAVYGDFPSYSSGVYKHVSGPLAGFHAVLVVGYDDPGQYFIVKNSWGAEWGEQGYFRIAYSEVAGDSQFGYETIAYYVGDDPNPTCEHALGDYFPASGGSGTIQMSITDGFNWAATSNDYWIAVPNFNDWHTGSGPFTFTLAPNTTSSARTGAVVVFDGLYHEKAFPVVQEASSSHCTYTVSPKTVSLDYSGGQGSITVTTGSGCAWAAQWLMLGTWVQDLHSGSGQIQYDFIKNPNVTPRTIVIKVADQDVTFNQAGTPVYFNPTSQNIPANGGAGTVAVTTDAQFNWTATSDADWITITSKAYGYGNGSISYSVPANAGASSRTGTITIGSSKFTITQPGGSRCAFSVFPTTLSISNGVENPEINITASASDCFWQATSHASWLVIGLSGSVQTGSGNGIAQYTVWGTNDPSSRTGTITIADKTVTVKQDGQTCFTPLSPTGQVFTSSGGTGTISVTASSDCYWYVTPANFSTWLTVTGGGGTRGNGTVTYTVPANAGTQSRQGFINIGLSTFTVTQAGGSTCSYSVSSTSQNVSASGGTGTVNVSAASGCAWAATSNVAWITVTGGSSGSGNAAVSYAVTANTDTASRSGTMTIAGKTFTVTQAGGSTCTYGLSPATGSLTSSGGAATVSVTTGAGCSWGATSNATWIAITGGSSGSGNGTVTYSVAPYAGSTMSRVGTLTIGTATYQVTQQAATTCTYAYSPANSSFPSSGGTGTISVTTGSGCEWLATTYNATWIAITSGRSGSGNGTVTYAVDANTGSSSRNFTMNVQGHTFTVTQGGSTCTYAISLTGNPFSAAGGTGSVNVTAGSGCAWSLSSSSTSWLTVPYDPSGSGSGTLNYYVAANTTTSSRNGTLTIAGQTFTVTQAGSGTCSYSISPTSQNVSASGGPGIVTVTAGSGCTWTATSNNTSWLSVTGGASGSDNGTVSYAVTANTTTALRNGTLTIGGQTFTVSQAAQACTYSISPTSNSLSAATGTGSVGVTCSGSSCSWTAVSNAPSWLSVTSGASGSGNGSVGYSVTANTTTTSRSGTLTIGGQTFTVTQAGMACTYSINPTSQTYTSAAGSGSVNVTAPSGCGWISGSNTSWLSITYGGAGSGNGTVSYSVTANTSTTSRSGSLTIAGQPFTVSQAAGGPTCTYTLTPTSQSYTAGGVPSYVNVTAPSGCTWTSASNTSWLSITSGGSGSGNGTVYFNVAANSGASRTGTMTIANQTFTATQAAMTCTYSINPTSNSFSAAAGTGTVTVTAGSGCAWTAVSNNTSWMSITGGASGSGNGTVSYSVTANSGSSSRNGTLTVGGQTLTVTQQGVSTCAVSLSAGGFNVSYASRQLSFTVNAASTCSWSTTTTVPWMSVTSGATGKGNGTVIFTVDTNTGSARTGTISVNNSSLIVNQSGSTTCTYALNSTSQSIAVVGGSGTVTVSAGSGCAWTAASNASWITVTGSGTGNGSVTYTVQANTGSSRTGTLTIAGQTFTVTQAGAATCSYTLNPANQNFSTTGGSGTVNVTAAAGCSWTAASNVSWLTVTPGIRGSGNGSVSYSVAANTGTARTGTLTIANQTFAVNQDGTSPTCQVSLSTGGFNFGYAARQGQFQVQAASSCSWNASASAPWITFNSGATGKGNGTVVFTIDTNMGAARTGTISVNGASLTVNEQAHP